MFNLKMSGSFLAGFYETMGGAATMGGVTDGGVPAKAILYNGVPMRYNGKYILFTKL